MSVFAWPAPFWVVVRRKWRGIDKDYSPRGHSGCARRKWPCRGGWRCSSYTYTAWHVLAGKPTLKPPREQPRVVLTRGGSEPRGGVRLGLGSAPFEGAFSPWTQPSRPLPVFPPSLTP